MLVVDHLNRPGYEQVTVFTDAEAGLQAIVAIHDATLGPACGGTRIWPYATEEEALGDVLLLARAMTYKAAVAGLDIGGGKAVIIADPRTGLTETLLRAFGRCLNTLDGRFLTTADVGGTGRDMEIVSTKSDYVVGLPVSQGGSGDSSIMSGLGLYVGMKACAGAVWGSDSLRGRRVAMQGFGKVGTRAAVHLLAEGAHVVSTALHDSTLRKARSMGVETVAPDEIYDVDCDIFSPCALGGVINRDTIPRLSCRIVAGAANNQLATAADGDELHRLGILYAPDFVINAGGIINLSAEVGAAYDPAVARAKTERIYGVVERVIEASRREGMPTTWAANRLAEERLAAARSA